MAYALWGLIGIIIGIMIAGIGVVPIAFLASLFNGLWPTMASIAFGLVLTFGTRGLGLYIATKAEPSDEDDQALTENATDPISAERSTITPVNDRFHDHSEEVGQDNDKLKSWDELRIKDGQ